MRETSLADSNMLNKLLNVSKSAWYWSSIIVIGTISEAVALHYQYVLDFRPCVVCIHVRIWIIGLILVAVLGLLTRHSGRIRVLSHALATLMITGILERSYQLLGTERGWIFGSCDFDLGLPGWLALQEWAPAIFKVWEACGYTPELWFGITMAEGLLAIYASLLLLSVALMITAFTGRNQVTTTLNSTL